MFDRPSAAHLDPSDGTRLLERIACGDHAALEELYDIYSAVVFGAAVAILRDRSLAEDAAQETFLGVWHNAGSFRSDIASARSWITAIARNRSIDMLRRRTSRPVELSLESAPDSGESNVWSEVVRRMDRDTINGLMARLPYGQRRAIQLAFVRGLTHVEIAKVTGSPLGTVKSRVRLGLLAIRRMAEEDVAASEPSVAMAGEFNASVAPAGMIAFRGN